MKKSIIVFVVCILSMPCLFVKLDQALDKMKDVLDTHKLKYKLHTKYVNNIFTEYLKQNSNVKEYMTNQAVQELIDAGVLKKGKFDYNDYSETLKMLDKNALEHLKPILQDKEAGSTNAHEIVAKYLNENHLDTEAKQVEFIKHHYIEKNIEPEMGSKALKDLFGNYKSYISLREQNKKLNSNNNLIKLGLAFVLGDMAGSASIMAKNSWSATGKVPTESNIEDTKDLDQMGYTAYMLTALIAFIIIAGMAFYITKTYLHGRRYSTLIYE